MFHSPSSTSSGASALPSLLDSCPMSKSLSNCSPLRNLVLGNSSFVESSPSSALLLMLFCLARLNPCGYSLVNDSAELLLLEVSSVFFSITSCSFINTDSSSVSLSSSNMSSTYNRKLF